MKVHEEGVTYFKEPVDVRKLSSMDESLFDYDYPIYIDNFSSDNEINTVIMADETHLNSIFSNLILNAKDALLEINSKKRRIDVFVDSFNHNNQNKIRIRVQDNGPGIPEAIINEIFKPFFSTKPTSGTGLGLGIVRKLLNLYDGEISVDSTAGLGAAFTITFPGPADE